MKNYIGTLKDGKKVLTIAQSTNEAWKKLMDKFDSIGVIEVHRYNYSSK